MSDNDLILECPCDSCEYSYDGCELGCSKLLEWFFKNQKLTGDDSVVVKVQG